MDKKGIELSFGMIFSIILIIFFLGFAFYVIKGFVDLSENANIGIFIDDFQKDIDNVWNSPQSSVQRSYNLPSTVEQVCITEDSLLSFLPEGSAGNLDYSEIRHIDFLKITEKGRYCMKVSNGKLNVILKKDFRENLVFVEEA